MPIISPDVKELRAIVDWVNVTGDVRELSVKYGDVELFISRDRQSVASPAPATASIPPVTDAPAMVPTLPAPAPSPVQAAAVSPATPAEDVSSSRDLAPDEKLVEAPMVGIFYASPTPGAPAFVKVGDRVEAGQVLAIVEVMKLMTNIEAPVTGTVTKIFVDNEQAVEYRQALMVISGD